MSSTRHKELRLFEHWLLRGFRVLVAFTAGLVLSALVAFLMFGAALEYVPLVLAGIAASTIYQVFQHLIGVRISRTVQKAFSVTVVAVALLGVAYWISITHLDIGGGNRLLGFLFGTYLGFALIASGYVDDEWRPIRRIRSGLIGIADRMFQRPPVIESIAFASAVVLSILVNVPRPHPGLQSGLAMASAIVTLSVAWFAHFASPSDHRKID